MRSNILIALLPLVFTLAAPAPEAQQSLNKLSNADVDSQADNALGAPTIQRDAPKRRVRNFLREQGAKTLSEQIARGEEELSEEQNELKEKRRKYEEAKNEFQKSDGQRRKRKQLDRAENKLFLQEEHLAIMKNNLAHLRGQRSIMKMRPISQRETNDGTDPRERGDTLEAKSV